MDLPRVFVLPPYISIDAGSYEFFANLYGRTATIRGIEILIDFKNCAFFEGNMFAVLGSILEDLKTRKNKIFLTNTSETMRSFIFRNGFLQGFEPIDEHNPYNTTSILYKKFHIENEQEIKDYLESELFSKPNLPFISDALKKEMIKSIFEIYSNALIHGESEFVYSCGQLLNKRTLNFTFVDLGHTIKNKVVQFLNKPMSGKEAIAWATSDNNTTKTGNHSGGFGLKVIQEFLNLNKGRLQIVSGEGFWEKSNDTEDKKDMSFSFPGTIVNLIFNLKDSNQYYLSSELTSVNNIF